MRQQLDADGRLISWASDIDEGTVEQALKTARLPIVEDHVALMPDAHVGIGATVGSVIPTREAVIPSAVGVDIGCGMIAVETDLYHDELVGGGQKLLDAFEQAVPAGVGKGHLEISLEATEWYAMNKPRTELDLSQERRLLEQFGSLGAGNHFLEACSDENGIVWLVLHSGSRGIGNQLAQMHIAKAKNLEANLERGLEDPDLAYFTQGTPEFNDYIEDMLWAQDYALANRERMMDNALAAFFSVCGAGFEAYRINCHHNFSALEQFGQGWLWITRKGAIAADKGQLGVSPGSMGTRSYIVSGLGNIESWKSCSHGAGRRMSRGRARRELSAESLTKAMGDRLWQSSKADQLVDEHPEAYKDIDRVMDDQKDLVEVVHTLSQFANYKGTT
jgi:RNA-splicing ligase RtcB